MRWQERQRWILMTLKNMSILLATTLLDQMMPITDKMERDEPGTGAELLYDIGNIIEDQIKHDRAFTTIYTGIGCKGKGLTFLLERK